MTALHPVMVVHLGGGDGDCGDGDDGGGGDGCDSEDGNCGSSGGKNGGENFFMQPGNEYSGPRLGLFSTPGCITVDSVFCIISYLQLDNQDMTSLASNNRS